MQIRIDKSSFTRENIFGLLITLYSFFLPFRLNISSTILFILLVHYLVDYRNIKIKIKRAFSNSYFKYFVLLFVLHLVGLLYTANFKYALTDIEIKISLLLLPFLLLGEELISKRVLELCLQYFVLGCLITSFIAVSISSVHYLNSGDINHFFYGGLAFVMHSSYFAMYLTFSIAILLLYVTNKTTNLSVFLTIICYTIIIFFVLVVILLSSRAGLIGLILTAMLFILYLLKDRQFVKAFFILLIGGAAYFFVVNIAPTSVQRFKSLNSKTINYSAFSENDPTTELGNEKDNINKKDTRLAILEISVGLFKEHPLIGVGTGDIKDVLVEKYTERNFLAGMDKKLNCHNQFVQFLLAFGSIGLILFLVSLFVPTLNALRNQNYIYVYFIFLVCFNFLFESMLETKAGVEFFSFFNVLLILYHTKVKNSDKIL